MIFAKAKEYLESKKFISQQPKGKEVGSQGILDSEKENSVLHDEVVQKQKIQTISSRKKASNRFEDEKTDIITVVKKLLKT